MEPDFINPFKRYWIVAIPEPVACFRGLSPGAKLVYGRLQRYAGKKGAAFPHIPELAEEVGLGERQTREYLNELVDQGFIHRERVFAKGNVYRFLEHPCLRGKEIGESRANSGAFSNRRDTAEQSNRRDAADPNRRDAADREGGASLLSLRESEEESQNTPFTPIDPETATPILCSRFKGLPRVRGFQKPLRDLVARKVSQITNDYSWEQVEAAWDAYREESFWREYGDTKHIVGAFFVYLANRAPATRTPRPVAAQPVSAPAVTAAPVRSLPERWNELVPERPVDPLVIAGGNLDSLPADRFDEICNKAREVIQAGGKMSFGSLLRRDRDSQLYGWQKLLAGDYDFILERHHRDAKKRAIVSGDLARGADNHTTDYEFLRGVNTRDPLAVVSALLEKK